MQLPRGVTGFYKRGKAAPPDVDTKAFKVVCYGAALAADAQILEVDVRVLVRSYHRCKICLASGIIRQIVCNKYYPLVAIAREGPELELYPQLVDEPELTIALSAFENFEVLSMQFLNESPSITNIALLCSVELKQISYWKARTIGQVIFNGWD